MSGGSYNYIYSRLSEECKNRMYDVEMDDLIKDLCEVLHDLEWWQSCDSSEEEYRESLVKFKAKWFKDNRQEQLKGYIDDQISIVRKQLYDLIGVPTKEPFINKPCISSGACKHDKNEVLDKIRAEVKHNSHPFVSGMDIVHGMTLYEILQVIDKCKEESEEKE